MKYQCILVVDQEIPQAIEERVHYGIIVVETGEEGVTRRISHNIVDEWHLHGRHDDGHWRFQKLAESYVARRAKILEETLIFLELQTLSRPICQTLCICSFYNLN